MERTVSISVSEFEHLNNLVAQAFLALSVIQARLEAEPQCLDFRLENKTKSTRITDVRT